MTTTTPTRTTTTTTRHVAGVLQAWEAALEPFDLAAALKLTVRPRLGDTEVVGGATRVRARFHQLSSAYPRDREYYDDDEAYVPAVTKFRRLALAFRVLTTAEQCAST